MAYMFLSVWIIPFGIVLIVRTIPLQLRGLRAAVERDEKIYWALDAAGCIFVAYGTVATGLLMVDDFCGGWLRLSTWWPSISRLWCATNDHTIVILLDLLTALGAGLAAICAARYFGYVDENDVWRKPDWRAGGRAENLDMAAQQVVLPGRGRARTARPAQPEPVNDGLENR